jgi:hypothetical protein
MDWQERAGRHFPTVNEHLVKHPGDLKHVQVYDIHVKTQGKMIALAMAIIVNTRLWWCGVIARK